MQQNYFNSGDAMLQLRGIVNNNNYYYYYYYYYYYCYYYYYYRFIIIYTFGRRSIGKKKVDGPRGR